MPYYAIYCIDHPEHNVEKRRSVRPAHLQRLKELDLSDNCLDYIDPKIGEMKGLKWLDLRNNNLSELPVSIAALAPHLKELFLEGNHWDEETKEDIMEWLPKTNIYFDPIEA